MSATVTDVPSPLATPTDLQNRAGLVEALNLLAVDAVALYLKTKNYHWHVSGSHFRDYHLLFDGHAEDIIASVDILAERVRKIGGTTLRSVSYVSGRQRVEDDDRDFVEPLAMLQSLLRENSAYAENMRAAHGMAEDIHDAGTSGVLETLIDQVERRVWFLYEAAQGGEYTH